MEAVSSWGSGEWVMLSDMQTSVEKRTAEQKKIASCAFEDLSPVDALDYACKYHTGKSLGKDLAVRIVHMAGFCLHPETTSFIDGIANRFKRLALTDKVFIEALDRCDWKKAWAASRCAFGNEQTGRNAETVLKFAGQGRALQAEYLLRYNDRDNALQTLEKTLDKDARLFRKAVPCYLRVYKEDAAVTRQIHALRIACDPDDAEAHWDLVKETVDRGWVVNSKGEWTVFRTWEGAPLKMHSLLKKVIELDPTKAEAYEILAWWCHDTNQIALNNGMNMTGEELLQTSLSLNPEQPSTLCALAEILCQKKKKSCVLDGKEWTVDSLLKHALTLDRDNAYARYILAKCATCSRGKKIILLVNAITSAIKKPTWRDKTYFHRYLECLAETLSKEEKVFLPHLKKEMDQVELYRMVVELAERYISPLVQLVKLTPTGSSFIINGKKVSRKELILKGIEIGAQNSDRSDLYLQLFFETGRRQLSYPYLEKALAANQRNLEAWRASAKKPFPNPEHKLTCKYKIAVLEKQEILLSAIKKYPNDPDFYSQLADALDADETIPLKNGQVVNKAWLMQHAQALQGKKK